MHPTLRSVLASPALQPGAPEVLAGDDRLDTPVRWVHVSEVADVAGLLQGGELILSTGIAMSEDVDPVGYVRALVGAGAAGLVVELGPRLPEVPAAAVAAAREARFPLIALHGTVRFVEVTEEIHRGIVAEQYAQVELAREVHETFTRLSLETADPTTIVTTTAELCGTSVVLEDLTRHVVAFAAVGRPAAGLLADWESRSRRTPVLEATGLTGPEGWLCTPVGGRGHRWGRLVLPNPQAAQARLTMVVERAAQALELGRMVERDRISLELRAQGGFLADLAAGRIPDEETALARATALGLPAAARYVPVAARRTTSPAGPGAERDLLEQVSRAARLADVTALVGALPDQQAGVVLAVPAGPRRAPDEDAALASLARALADEHVLLGVGLSSSSLQAAGAGLGQAAHVAEAASAMPGPRRAFYRNADVRLYGLLALLHDDPRVQAYVEAELAPLLEHEARHGSGLLDLLRQYVAVGGHKTRLAETAHRSRPAVYKKLAQLERILGADLDDPMSFLSVSVAVLAHDQSRVIDPPR